jgi:4-hydroxythreonine-4-phosphate dehydrogenase
VTLTLGVTLGEPAGIGPEVTVGALSSPEVVDLGARFVLFGPRPIYERAAQALETAGRDPGAFRKLVEKQRVQFGEPVLDVRGNWGQPAPEDEKAVVESIRQACAAALSGQIAGMVTAPLDKRALFHQGYPGWGHTELLAHFTDAPRQPWC